jgi:FtsP/CotA-like multicopper oxidase with cupredoxin domain
VDAGRGRRHLRRRILGRRGARSLAAVGVLVLGAFGIYQAAFAGSGSKGRTIDYWVAAVPVVWNIAPNGHDALAMDMKMPSGSMPGMMGMVMGATLPTSQTVVRTVVYRRYSAHWKKPLPNADPSSADGLLIPGPLIQARVGDHLRIHFKNMDTLRRAPHSMHFHGVHYAPSSDGAYLPGFSGRDADVLPGQTYTYRLTAGADSAGVWPYHDHSPSMHASIDGGMYGMLSILGRHERAPDREFEVVFAPWGKFMTIDGRAYVGNTPVFRAKVGEVVQWDVMAMGSDFHTFHVHGHRWLGTGNVARDTQTVGPAESFRIRWKEDAPGTWRYHCHVEDHMMHGMIGIYRVST